MKTPLITEVFYIHVSCCLFVCKGTAFLRKFHSNRQAMDIPCGFIGLYAAKKHYLCGMTQTSNSDIVL